MTPAPADDLCANGDVDLMYRVRVAFLDGGGTERIALGPALRRVVDLVKAYYATYQPLPPGPSPRERRTKVFADLTECERHHYGWCEWRGDEPCHCRVAADREAEAMT